MPLLTDISRRLADSDDEAHGVALEGRTVEQFRRDHLHVPLLLRGEVRLEASEDVEQGNTRHRIKASRRARG